MSFFAHAASVVSAKGAIGLTVAALAVGGAGAEAAITDSANPGDWGQQVVQQYRREDRGRPGHPVREAQHFAAELVRQNAAPVGQPYANPRALLEATVTVRER